MLDVQLTYDGAFDASKYTFPDPEVAAKVHAKTETMGYMTAIFGASSMTNILEVPEHDVRYVITVKM